MTTVGYGDITPHSELTRILIGYPAILLGVFFVGYVLSDISTRVFEANRSIRKGLKRMKDKNHLIVIRFVGEERIKSVVAEIGKDKSSYNDDIVLIDDQIREVSASLGVHFVFGDPSLASTLNRANVAQAKAVIIFTQTNSQGATSDLKNIAVVLAIREITANVPIIAECYDPKYSPLLKSAGSTHTVCLEEMREQIIVQELLDPGIVSVMHELTSNLSGNQLYIVQTPSEARTYQEIKQRLQHENICLLGIRRKSENFLAPDAKFPIEKDDTMICIARVRPALTG